MPLTVRGRWEGRVDRKCEGIGACCFNPGENRGTKQGGLEKIFLCDLVLEEWATVFLDNLS
jgi:hypothetical protein